MEIKDTHKLRPGDVVAVRGHVVRVARSGEVAVRIVTLKAVEGLDVVAETIEAVLGRAFDPGERVKDLAGRTGSVVAMDGHWAIVRLDGSPPSEPPEAIESLDLVRL